MAEKLIAIKGFQIPETCISCPMQFGGWCGVSPPEIDERVAETVDDAFEQKRPDWCPLVEVEPETAQWLHRSVNGYNVRECSRCGKQVQYVSNFCPDCGRKMTEVKQQ